MPTINLQDTPSLGKLTAADLERTPGPQTSKASPETWRSTDRAIFAMLAWAIVTFAVLGAVHIVAGAVAGAH